MKKKIIRSILIIVLSAAVVTGVFFFVRSRLTDSSSETSDMNFYEDELIFPILRSGTLAELEENAESAGIELNAYNDGLYKGFDGISIGTMSVTAVFQPESDKMASASVKFESNVMFDDGLEASTDVLKSYLNDSRYICSALFDIDAYELAHIYHSEGYILEESDEVYQEILAGTAVFGLSVREADNSFWKINGYIQEEHFVLYMDRYFGGDFADVTADIVLQ